MKAKLISIILVVAIGIIVTALIISNKVAIEKEYNKNLASARYNAEKQIPYNAYNYYKAAFAIRCEDEGIFKEYVKQAELLGESYYFSAVNEYVELFPMSQEAYETLCKLLYEKKDYSSVMEFALKARENNAASEQVRKWYLECAYMLQDVKTELEEVQSFLGGYAMVKVKGNYGFISQSGKFVLAPTYTNASPMMGSSAAVNDGTEWYITNSLGFKIARTSKPVEYMGVLIGGKIPVACGGKYAYLKSDLIVPDNLPYDYASNFKNGVAAVKRGDKWMLIDTNEAQITSNEYEDIILDEYKTCFNSGVIFVKENGKYYMVNGEGERITDKAFDNARPFVSAEPAAVCVDGKWGFIDTNGNMVIEPKFSDAKSFNIGIGAVCVDGKWGYINATENIMIQYQFEDCLPFSANGITAVKDNGSWKFVILNAYKK